MYVRWFKPYPLQDALCRSVIVGAVDIVEAQKHTSVICWFKGTIIQILPLPLRPTEAVDMVETQREFSRAHVYWFKNNASFFQGMRFFCRSMITGAVDLVEAQSREHVV